MDNINFIWFVIFHLIWGFCSYTLASSNSSSSYYVNTGYSTNTGAITGALFGGVIALTIIVAVVFVICYNIKEKQSNTRGQVISPATSIRNFNYSPNRVPVEAFQIRGRPPPPYALTATPRDPPPYDESESTDHTNAAFDGHTGFINVASRDTSQGHNYEVLESVRSPPPPYSRGVTGFW